MIDRELMERLAKVFPRTLDVIADRVGDFYYDTDDSIWAYCDTPEEPAWGTIAYSIDQEFLAAGASVKMYENTKGSPTYDAELPRGRVPFWGIGDSFMEARIRAYLKWKEGEKE